MAQTLIERDGVEQLSLAQLAAALNIKAPSLYRHISSKTALLFEVNTLTFQLLFQAYEVAVQASGRSPDARLFAILQAHRLFAHAYPQTYVLAFTTTARDQRPDPAILERLVLPIQAEMEAISGSKTSLAALRGALALVHGFVMLEINQQFQRGGDLGEAFAQAVTAYLAGVRRDSVST
jgi:AcrR family transcriptional regulator